MVAKYDNLMTISLNKKFNRNVIFKRYSERLNTSKFKIDVSLSIYKYIFSASELKVYFVQST